MQPFSWVKRSLAQAEFKWFDFRRRVKTAGTAVLRDLTLAPASEHGFDYIAARPKNVKQALRDLPVKDHSQFTFIDLGSGKGPVLFLAAQYPFRRIVGVEFARELHQQAVENIASFRHSGRRCTDIASVHMDAKDFPFPEGNLVLYLFNPFPPRILQSALENLYASSNRVASANGFGEPPAPREVYIVALYPNQLAPLLKTVAWLRLEQYNARYHIYRGVLN